MIDEQYEARFRILDIQIANLQDKIPDAVRDAEYAARTTVHNILTKAGVVLFAAIILGTAVFTGYRIGTSKHAASQSTLPMIMDG